MYVEFKTDSKDLNSKENKGLGLTFNKGEVRYETRAIQLIENAVAKEVDYEAYLNEQKDDKAIAFTDKKAEQKETKKAETAAPAKKAEEKK